MRVVEGAADVDDVDAFVADLEAIGDRHGVAVQAVDARYVVDREHLERAVALADGAFERGEAIARDRAVEILLYAAGRRQIDRALAMGVREGEGPVAVVVHDLSAGGEDEDTAQEGDGTSRTSGHLAMTSDAENRAGDEVVDLLATGLATVGEYDEALVADFFDVGEAERAAADATLPDLVRERVALLTVEK